jgi:hypothetical protein
VRYRTFLAHPLGWDAGRLLGVSRGVEEADGAQDAVAGLDELSQAGFDNPIIKPLGADGASDKADALARRRTADLPDDWRLVQERDGESYRWPNGRDRYSRQPEAGDAAARWASCS